MKKLKLAVFADKEVGFRTVKHLFEKYPAHIKYLILTDKSSNILPLALSNNFKKELIFFNKYLYTKEAISKLKKIPVDYILLAWWPYILKKPFLCFPKIGVLNFHPSFLPYDRGKHYNFWTIVDDSPFGVSIHFVNEFIDGGDIVFQKKIMKTWEDNGKTLYKKAQDAMFQLFVESYPKIIKSDYIRIKQDLKKGSFHMSKELEKASQIYLDKTYKAQDLLNLLRARTFSPHPACYFFDKNKKYEVVIKIRKVNK